jgi:hypothetical protein
VLRLSACTNLTIILVQCNTTVEHFPFLAQQLGAAFAEQKLVGFCLNWLGDKVYGIREVGVAQKALGFVLRVYVCLCVITCLYTSNSFSLRFLFRFASQYQAAIRNLTKLADVFGADWAAAHILPKIVVISAYPSYLYRLTALYAAKDMAATLGWYSRITLQLFFFKSSWSVPTFPLFIDFALLVQTAHPFSLYPHFNLQHKP